MATTTNTSVSEVNDLGNPSRPNPASEGSGMDTHRLISEIKYLELDELVAHPRNMEIYGDIHDEELHKNIATNGVLTPLLATWDKVILSGHRRYHYAKLVGLTQVPVVFTDSSEELEMLELLLDGNVQRAKTNEAVGREIQIRMEIETAKAKKRQATAAQGKRGGQLDPAKSPEGIGDARQIVARKCGVGEKTVDAAVTVMNKVDDLCETGDHEQADELRRVLNTGSINAAKKKVSEIDSPKSGQAKPSEPAGGVAKSPPTTKAAVIARITRDVTGDLKHWPIEQIQEFEISVAEFKVDWVKNRGAKAVAVLGASGE